MVKQTVSRPLLPSPRNRILVADDDAVYRRFLQQVLTKNGYDVELVTNGADALQAAQADETCRLLLLDWVMPELQGPEVCSRLRQDNGRPYQYTLLLTSKDMKADVVAGLQAGADDYLTKPFDCNELLARLRVGERILDLQDSLLVVTEKLRHQATHDELTELWNRRAVMELLQAELDRCNRTNTGLTLLVVDIDHFKRVNDTYGHLIGDRVLKEIARRLSACCRKYDVIGRFGGEEFIMAVPDLRFEKPYDFASRMRRTIEESSVDTAAGAVNVTISIGMVSVFGAEANDLEFFIQRADEALYRAKAKGRNRIDTAE